MAKGKNTSETENKRITDPHNSSRRRAVKTIAGGVGALAAYHVMPVNWSKPIVEQVFLPAHAAVSGITLSDPCTAELVSGNQESSIDVIRIAGFVTPPVGGLEVTIVATPNGGSGGPVTVTTSTGSDGTYSAEITMVGGPGIVGVGATTTVSGVNGVAHCPVGIPPAGHPSSPSQPIPNITLTSSNITEGWRVPQNFNVSVTYTVTPSVAGETVNIRRDFPGGSEIIPLTTDSNGQVTLDTVSVFLGLYQLSASYMGISASQFQWFATNSVTVPGP